MDLSQVFSELTEGFTNFTIGNAIMITAGCVLIYLAAIRKMKGHAL